MEQDPKSLRPRFRRRGASRVLRLIGILTLSCVAAEAQDASDFHLGEFLIVNSMSHKRHAFELKDGVGRLVVPVAGGDVYDYKSDPKAPPEVSSLQRVLIRRITNAEGKCYAVPTLLDAFREDADYSWIDRILKTAEARANAFEDRLHLKPVQASAKSAVIKLEADYRKVYPELLESERQVGIADAMRDSLDAKPPKSAEKYRADLRRREELIRGKPECLQYAPPRAETKQLVH